MHKNVSPSSQFLLADAFQRVELHHCAKFRQNQSICCGEITILRFFKMAAVRHLGVDWGTFGPPSAKFGCHRCSSFDNMKVWIFGTFGLKTPIYVPKVKVLGGNLPPCKWQQYQRNPKGTSLCESTSFEPSSTKIRRPVCRRVPKKMI